MKYIKASLCSLVAFSCLSYIHSAEDLFAELKRTKKEFNADGIVVPETERNENINKGFKEIENEIFRDNPLPFFLKQLCSQVGNLGFSMEILSPIGGITSPLHDGIREGQEKNIPHDWVVFAKIDGCEYFCINRLDSQIARFLVFPEANPYKQHDTYPKPSEWVEKILLTD
ncbi:MAG: hypothetical protein ACOH2E_00880 [Candidatus Paracaedibacter sp.]